MIINDKGAMKMMIIDHGSMMLMIIDHSIMIMMIMIINDQGTMRIMITDHGLRGQGFIFPQRSQLDHLKFGLINDQLKFDYIVGDNFDVVRPVDDGNYDDDDDDVVHPVDDGIDNDSCHKAQ